MHSTKSLVLALLVAVALAGLGGCSCPCRVPVSLEPLNDWLLYHGPACWRYPYSCPSCPYTDCEHSVYVEPYSEEAVDRAPAPKTERPVDPVPPKPVEKT